jgi:peroxiredoxin
VDFAAQTLDGKPVSLAQFKGKYVLLAFWALWSERSTEHLVDFQKLQTELSHDNRVAFLGASLDNDAGAVRKAVEARGYQWTQTWLNSTNLANRPLKYGRVFSGAIFHG